jgi:hypothetical protein
LWPATWRGSPPLIYPTGISENTLCLYLIGFLAKKQVRKCANSAVDPELPSSNAMMNTWMPRYGLNTKIDQATSKLIRGKSDCRNILYAQKMTKIVHIQTTYAGK